MSIASGVKLGDVSDRAVEDQILAQILSKTDIMNCLEPGETSALTTQLQVSEFTAGQTIFAQGEPGDQLYVIVAGKVKITLRGSGDRENLRAVIGPMDLLGEQAVFDPGPRTRTATAITDVRAVWLDRTTLRTWIADRPVIAERLLQALTRRIQATEDELVELVFSDVAGRVARQLLLLARRFGTRQGAALRVMHELSQDEMAQLVGADRASVNKALRKFTDRGWILVDGKSVLITDVAALAQRAAARSGSGAYANRRRRPLRATA